VHQQGRQVAGHRDLAFAAHRVVDRICAGSEVRLTLAEGVHQLIELLQRFGGR
jgi:hypothetical protein